MFLLLMPERGELYSRLSNLDNEVKSRGDSAGNGIIWTVAAIEEIDN
jgi:hypothetical protein